VRIAQADVLMRGPESSESPDEGRRREGGWHKTRQNRDAALFHHRAAAKILGGTSEAPGTKG